MLCTWSSETIFQVADYSSVNGTPTRETVYTTSHHIWFIPLCTWWLRGRRHLLEPRHLWLSVLWILAVSAGTAVVVPLECVEWESPVHGKGERGEERGIGGAGGPSPFFGAEGEVKVFFSFAPFSPLSLSPLSNPPLSPSPLSFLKSA